MDPRLHDELTRWIEEANLGKYFLISLAGASKDLVDRSEEIRNNFLRHISVSVDSHQAEKIIIFHHSDCRAYAQDYRFASLQKEKEKQIKDMQISKAVILEKYPGIEIVLLWGDLQDSEGEKIIFETLPD